MRASREVAVTTGALDRAGERLLLVWSLATGGALVLEQPAARVATAAWARPTLFVGGREEVRRLATEAAEWEAAWRRGWTAALRRGLRRLAGRPAASALPFGRLHTVVVADGVAAGSAAPRPDPDTAPTAPDVLFWSRHGVIRQRLADLLP